MNFEIESLKPFFDKLEKQSADDPNTFIFLNNYEDVVRATRRDKSIIENDRSLKLKSILATLHFFCRVYGNLHILPEWKNQKVEKVNEIIKKILDQASIILVPLMFTHHRLTQGGENALQTSLSMATNHQTPKTQPYH